MLDYFIHDEHCDRAAVVSTVINAQFIAVQLSEDTYLLTYSLTYLLLTYSMQHSPS